MKDFIINFCLISGLVPWAVLVPLELSVLGLQTSLLLASLLSRKPPTSTTSILNSIFRSAMESQEVVQIIDLGDPQTLRELATEDNSRATPFISEFSRINEDSDIEEEEPDELPVRRRGQPIYRQALSIDKYDDDDDNESIETPEPTQGHLLWRLCLPF